MEDRKYEIWHDESKEGGYYHGVLFLPSDKKEDLIKLLKRIREEHSCPCDHNLKFSGCLKSLSKGRYISNNLALFSHIIKTRKTKYDELTPIYKISGEDKYYKNYKPFLKLNDLLGCRFGLLKIKDNLQSLHLNTYAKKVEVTFRFILRGCSHGMFDRNSPIEIKKLYFDGKEHHGNNIDLNTILKGDFRGYCKIAGDINIDDRQISERKDDTKIIMNFVDNIVGAWRARLDNEQDKHNVLYPLSEIHQRLLKRKIFSNPNGRWYRAISFSELCVEDGKLKFPNIFRNPKQYTFPYFTAKN